MHKELVAMKNNVPVEDVLYIGTPSHYAHEQDSLFYLVKTHKSPNGFFVQTVIWDNCNRKLSKEEALVDVWHGLKISIIEVNDYQKLYQEQGICGKSLLNEKLVFYNMCNLMVNLLMCHFDGIKDYVNNTDTPVSLRCATDKAIESQLFKSWFTDVLERAVSILAQSLN